MDIERLSKSQIVLLTLLVSFMTSIATGIVTVSLMDQAPPSIAKTVNRVIERTVEKVVPGPAGQAATTIVTQEKTVIVKESDLISQAVTKTAPSLARLYSSSRDNPTFLGVGVVIDANGTVITDTAALGTAGDAVLELSDGSQVRTFVSKRDEDSGLVYLASATTSIAGKAVTWTPIAISATKIPLGTTVVSLAGKSTTKIDDGLVTGIPKPGEGQAQMIETNVSNDAIMYGSPLINTDGALVGVSTDASRTSSPKAFLDTSILIPIPKKTASTQ